MRDIEHAGIGAHVVVFINLRAVVDRHIPAGKIHQLATIGNMLIVERSLLSHGAQLHPLLRLSGHARERLLRSLEQAQ